MTNYDDVLADIKQKLEKPYSPTELIPEINEEQLSELHQLRKEAMRQFAAMKDELLQPIEKTIEDEIFDDMFAVLKKLKEAKPKERSEKARYYAICITEFEKVISSYYTMIGLDLFGESGDN